MITSTVAEPLTARAIFFAESGADPTAVLTQSMETGGVAAEVLRSIGRLSNAAQVEVKRQVAVVAGGVLDVNVVDLLVGGWRKHAALVAAARHTLVVPGSEEVVDLASHRIRSVHRPYVSVLIDDVQVAKIDFELTVVFEIKALVAVVRAGRLVALSGGQCEAAATIAAEGVLLVQQRRLLDLNARLPLGDGIQLLAARAADTSPVATWSTP